MDSITKKVDDIEIIIRVEAQALSLTLPSKNKEKEMYLMARKAEHELLQLAKLGQAALEALEKGGYVSYKSSMRCFDCNAKFEPDHIDDYCECCYWLNFCKLRKEIEK